MNRRSLPLFVAALCLVLFTHQASPNNLPNLGSESTVEEAIEARLISDLFLHELYPYLLQDPELVYYLQTLGNRLVLSSPQLQEPLRFHLLNDPSINAFAVPGGFIGVHVGLFLLANNESELAAVIAHEIAHIAQKHYQRNKEEMARVMILNTAALLAAIQMVGSSQDPGVDNLGSAVIAGSLALTSEKYLQFSRQHEEEADRLGMEILVNSGFDPNGMADFFAQLAKASQLYQQPPEFMSTHPVTQSRVADTRFRAQKRDPGNLRTDSLQFQLMKAKLRVLSHDSPDSLLPTLEHELGEAQGNERTALRYAKALILIQQQQFNRSGHLITQLRQQHPDVVSLQLLQTDLLLHQYRASESDKSRQSYQRQIGLLYQGLLQDYPQNFPITAYYADALIQMGEALKARNLLRDYLSVVNRPDSPELYSLLAMAEWQLGDKLAHFQATAQYNYWKGDINGAIRQINLALKQSDITPLDRQRLGNLLTRYQQEATERKKILP